MKLPPSLAQVPNIPLHEQTLEQLLLERDYWREKVNGATEWGAGYAFAFKQMKACERMIERKINGAKQ